MRDAAPEVLLERQPHGPVEVLAIRRAEVIQAETIEQLGREIRQAVDASDAAGFVLDLARVRFMTSGALGLIIHLRAQLAERGRRLVMAGATGDVAHVLECTRLAKVIPIYTTADEAVRDIGCGPAAGR